VHIVPGPTTNSLKNQNVIENRLKEHGKFSYLWAWWWVNSHRYQNQQYTIETGERKFAVVYAGTGTEPKKNGSGTGTFKI